MAVASYSWDAFNAAAASQARRVAIVEGPEAVEAASADWLRLAAHGRAQTCFQSLGLARACADAHERVGDTVRVIIVSRDGQPKVIFPTAVCKLFGAPIVRLLGDPLIQYGDILASEDASREDFDLAWSVAVDPAVACYGHFRHVREDSSLAAFIRGSVPESNSQESLIVDLRADDTLSPRQQRELRRLKRRLAEEGPVDIQFLAGADARPWLEEALSLKRDWVEANGLASAVIGDPNWEQPLHALCEDDAEKGQLTVAILRVGDRLAAAEVAFVDGACWYGFLGAYAPEFSKMGPGQVLTAECIAHARAAGLTFYDQLPPAAEYKRRHSTDSVRVCDFGLPLNVVGRLVGVALQLKPALKDAFNSMPSDSRRQLLSLVGRRGRGAPPAKAL